MLGAMLRGKPPAMWKRVDELLRSADLEKIKVKFPEYPYTDVLRAIQVSVDALDATMRERYLALAVTVGGDAGLFRNSAMPVGSGAESEELRGPK